MLQNLDAADAVAFFVQRRTKDTDTHVVDQRCCNAAADAALGREADGHGKFTRAVVHSAGQHQGADFLGTFPGNQLLLGDRTGAVVGKHGAHLGDVHCGDVDRAHLKIKIQALFYIAF